MKYVLTVVLFSLAALAFEVGQDIELTQFLNARRSANFVRTARNREGVLPTGTHAHIEEVKTLRSGNSGLKVTVKDGAFKDKVVWIYYNKNSPGMKLADASGTPVAAPAPDVTATTTRAIAATVDLPAPQSTDPLPSPASIVSPTPMASPAPAVVPTPAPPVTALIDRANGALTGAMSPGGPSGCRDCATVAAAASPVPTPNPVVTPSSASPAPRAGDHIETASEDGIYIQNADVKCSYRDIEFPRNPQIYPGTIDVKIENYNVTRLDAQIDGCRVQLGDYQQVRESTITVNGVTQTIPMPPRNIVLRNAAGCTVVFSVNQATRGSRRPSMQFGWVVVGNSPCARQCPNSLRKFWQVNMDPVRQICH